jgi:hypothetical protein
MTLWDVFQTLREQLSQIFEVVKTVVDALDKIVKGTLEPAQKRVEEVLAGVLPVAIGLLARLVGLGGSDASGATKAPSAAGAAVSPASGGMNCSVVGRSWCPGGYDRRSGRCWCPGGCYRRSGYHRRTRSLRRRYSTPPHGGPPRGSRREGDGRGRGVAPTTSRIVDAPGATEAPSASGGTNCSVVGRFWCSGGCYRRTRSLRRRYSTPPHGGRPAVGKPSRRRRQGPWCSTDHVENCGRFWSYKGPLRGWRRGVPRERGKEL